jgi:hypothetical protein
MVSLHVVAAVARLLCIGFAAPASTAEPTQKTLLQHALEASSLRFQAPAAMAGAMSAPGIPGSGGSPEPLCASSSYQLQDLETPKRLYSVVFKFFHSIERTPPG